MIWAVSLVILLSASDVSCQTVVTYSSKSSEELICPITDQTLLATWSDETSGNTLFTYERGQPDIEIVAPGSKHINFMSNASATSFTLFIQDVEAEDGGVYVCITGGGGTNRIEQTVFVEVLAKPTVQYESQDVDVLNVTVGTSYDLTCSAAGARSVSDLSLVWDPSLVVKTPLSITPSSDDYKDYSITSTYTAVRVISSITCQLTGYVMQDEINGQRMELISHAVNLNVRYAPICNMTLKEGEDCRNVTLTCKCEAVPADITQYSFFDPSLIYNGASNEFTTSAAYGTISSFSCSATNSIGPGDQTDPMAYNCDEDPFPIWVIILIIVVVLAVVIAVIAVIMYKKGKCGSNSSSDKPDDNGAGPGKDPEIPAYGVIDKNRTKDPTPAPRSSMRDSKNPSNPKQDGPVKMEMQYADLDHGNKPPSDEVRKPKEEPTEYATVQSVIV